jgi:hypothetical protein
MKKKPIKRKKESISVVSAIVDEVFSNVFISASTTVAAIVDNIVDLAFDEYNRRHTETLLQPTIIVKETPTRDESKRSENKKKILKRKKATDDVNHDTSHSIGKNVYRVEIH